jgi:hypothetical protein
MKRQVDRHRSPSRDYQVGDKVWLETTNLNLKIPSQKLGSKRVGPFEVTKRIGEGAYHLKLPSGWRAIHPVFNESLLSPYIPPFADHQKKPPPPPPEIVDGVAEHLVERIRDSRAAGTGASYYVEWVGYGREDDSWEPWANLENAKRKVHEFHLQNPDKPKSAGYKKWVEQGGHRAETPDL